MVQIAKMIRLVVNGDGLRDVEIVPFAELYDNAVANRGESRYSLTRYHLAKHLDGRVPEFTRLHFTEIERFEAPPASKSRPRYRSRVTIDSCVCNDPANEDRTFYCPYHGQQ